jgi:hypothetical protein
LANIATELTQSIKLGQILALLTTSASTAIFLNVLFKTVQERLPLYDAAVTLFLVYILQMCNLTSLFYHVSLPWFMVLTWIVMSTGLGCASFFLKVFLHMSSFGSQPDCNNLTYIVILWRPLHLVTGWVQAVLVGIFGIFVVLLSSLSGVWTVYTLWVCFSGSASPIFEGFTRPSRPPLSEAISMPQRVNKVMRGLCAQGLLIWWLERTVKWNVVETDPNGSSVGQYVATLILLGQIISTGLYFYRRPRRDEESTV